MSVLIKAFQAKNGESFLIKIIEKQEINILIDLGTANTYRDEIRPILSKMNDLGKKIDYLILTHTHSDHIGGAVPFFIENGNSNESKVIKIEHVLYNGFLGLNLREYPSQESNEEEKLIYQGISKQAQAFLEKDEENKEISMKEEVCISKLLIEGEYNWNGRIKKPSPLIVQESGVTIPIAEDDIYFQILSPDYSKIDKLNSEWEKYLKKVKRKLNFIKNSQVLEAYEAFMLLTQQFSVETLKKNISKQQELNIELVNELSKKAIAEDDNPGNGTSLAFLLNVQNKKLLFLGDAHPSIYTKELNRIFKEEEEVKIDFIKLAHHGSMHNTTKKFLEKYIANKFLVSTAGRDGHPNLETLAQIVTSSNCEKTIYYTNLVDSIKMFDKKVISNEFNYKIIDATKEEILLD